MFFLLYLRHRGTFSISSKFLTETLSSLQVLKRLFYLILLYVASASLQIVGTKLAKMKVLGHFLIFSLLAFSILAQGSDDEGEYGSEFGDSYGDGDGDDQYGGGAGDGADEDGEDEDEEALRKQIESGK